MPGVTLESLGAWMDAYGRAWVSNDPGEVASLFSEDAVYSVSPFKEPWRGRRTIVKHWTGDPMGGQRDVMFEATPLAAWDEHGIAHWKASFVSMAESVRVEMDGVLLVRFDPDGRCTEHREWYARRDRPLEGGG